MNNEALAGEIAQAVLETLKTYGKFGELWENTSKEWKLVTATDLAGVVEQVLDRRIPAEAAAE
jgi:hypothetical protein